MSFSTDVKKELLDIRNQSTHCNMAELASLICYNVRIFSKDGHTFLSFDTENSDLLRKYFTLLNRTIKISNCEKVLSDKDAETVLTQLGMISNDGLFSITTDSVNQDILKLECCKRAYVRGAFLSSGSISDPHKDYHFEIVCDTENQSSQLVNILGQFGIRAKTSIRKGHVVCYLKGAEDIADALRLMGAGVSVMELENIIILKDMRNSVNRKVNCETANISKTIKTAIKQIEDIELIASTIGLESLPDSLQEMARVRVEHEDVALKDLGSYLSKPISKSGVNHRLSKLAEIADDIRSGGIE